MATAIDFKALGALAAAEGVDMTKAQTGGGGDYTPPAAGPTRLRFIGYVELGKHTDEWQGVKKDKEKVHLIFELSGPKHQPNVGEDGTKHPARISIEESLSLNEKANFFKLFTRMNYAGTATHMAQLLGQEFLGTVVHKKYKRKDGTEATIALLKGEDGYTIKPPRFEDQETGEMRVVQVDPPISPIKCFLWNYADLEQWASIFIDGEYAERKNDKGEVTALAKSKNVDQNKIKSAKNFEGSVIHGLLVAGGQNVDIPASTQDFDDVPTKPQAAKVARVMPDPLANDDIPF